MNIRQFVKTSMLCIGMHCYSANAIEPVEVDIELQLLIDVSGSVNTNEYQLQLLGYKNAFESYDVQQAIINGHLGQIAVQMVMWSGPNQQEVVVDWTLIDSANSSDDFATAMTTFSRPFSGMTAIGSAINFAYPLFDQNNFTSNGQIIDISGDGSRNSGLGTQEAVANALSNGVDTINGIVITDSQYVIDEYANEVIAGDSPFLLAPADFDAFQNAIEAKIIAEIEGSTPEGAVAIDEPHSNSLFLLALTLLFIRKRFLKEFTL